MTAVKIEFLMGRAAAKDFRRWNQSHEWPPHPDRLFHEWPPHPDRLFQAFVAAWGAGDGRDNEEEAALEWLEGLPAPRIFAPRVAHCVADSFSGVRASAIKTKEHLRISANGEMKGMACAEQFVYQHPAGAAGFSPLCAWVVWDGDADDARLATLQKLAARVPYFGRSTSPAALSVCAGSPPDEEVRGMDCYVRGFSPTEPIRLRVPFNGRLTELKRWFENRPTSRSGGRPRPPGRDFSYCKANADESSAVEIFRPLWKIPIVLRLSDKYRPPLAGTALIARAMRNAILENVNSAAAEVKNFVSGHTTNRGVARCSHLACLPMANVGSTHSDGEIHGVALALPSDTDDRIRRAVCDAARNIEKLGVGGRRNWRLESVDPEETRVSLNPSRYCREARRWETVTPALISRMLPPLGKKPDRAARLLKRMVSDEGYPEPDKVEINPVSPIPGVAPSFEFGDAGLHRDRRGEGRRLLMHLRVEFKRPVSGPVLIGAGLHRGMGLMLPVGDKE